jgi:nucleoside-diphosphate-sugar epimerase
MLRDTKVLMTGATGMVGRPIAMELARTNEVWADLMDTDLPALPDVD